jgi:pyrrolidone-carboxylate peptidase
VSIGTRETPVTKAERLLLIAQEIAEATPTFFIALGQGPGNLRTNVFTAELEK